MSVRLDALTKAFGATRVIDGLTTTFPSGSISVLLGPSGCGKTTTLRCIAGLETPDEGSIVVGDAEVFHRGRGVNLPPERRDLAMVFQSYAIWPHMTVAENVALPLRAHRLERKDHAAYVKRALELVGLTGLEGRLATQLSGGQQQRVALARSIVRPSRVILLDEPMSNLDAQLRVATRKELRHLQRELRSTMIFVTHDQEEAMSLADEVFLYKDGRVVQHGPPHELYRSPNSRYVAEFLGKANFIRALPVALSDGSVELRASGGECIGMLPATSVPADARECLCVIRPEAWQLRAPSEPGIAGRVVEISFLGDREEITVETALGPISVIALSNRRARVGDAIRLYPDAHAIHVLHDAP